MESDELYRRLQQHLDRMPVGFPATESGVEIRILKRLFTPAHAEVALELSAVPEPVGAIHKRLAARFSLEQVQATVEEMAAKGLILSFPSKGGMRYGKMPFALGFYERQVKWLTPELERDSRQYMDEAFHQAFHKKKTTQMRTVPVNRAIPVDRYAATYDNIKAFVDASPGPFAAMTCICRHGKDLTGEHCKRSERRDNCLAIGPAAKWAISGEYGHALSKAEMVEALEQADRDGLVLQPENTQNPLFVCCCCDCCCGVLTSVKRFPRPAEYFSSNYYADVDQELCGACGTCETRCPMEAIRVEDGKANSDRERCIGCGLCATTCSFEAIVIKDAGEHRKTPSDSAHLYLRLLRERYGPWGFAKMMAQTALGRKI